MLTRLKDTDALILSELDDESLLNLCIVDNTLCQDDNFWRDRFINNFQKFDKSSNISWRKLYLGVLYYLDSNQIPKDADLIKLFKNNGFLQIGLRKAAERGDVKLVQTILKKKGGGIEIDLALIGAAKGSHKALIDYLIEKGAKMWEWGMMGAVLGGHKDIIDFFIEKGANNWSGGLNYAMKTGRKDLIEFFQNKINNNK